MFCFLSFCFFMFFLNLPFALWLNIFVLMTSTRTNYVPCAKIVTCVQVDIDNGETAIAMTLKQKENLNMML